MLRAGEIAPRDRRRLAARAWYVIARREGARTTIFVLPTPTGGETLPVFATEDDAKNFLGPWLLESGWAARESTAGELISLLMGPCRGVEQVALDPPAGEGAELLSLVSVGRARFVRALLGERASATSSTGVPAAGRRRHGNGEAV